MGFRRGLGLSAGLALALLIPAASAFGDVSSGPLHAAVGPDPWHLTVTDGSGHTVLSENRGLGGRPRRAYCTCASDPPERCPIWRSSIAPSADGTSPDSELDLGGIGEACGGGS
jgi:hypothetical protein